MTWTLTYGSGIAGVSNVVVLARNPERVDMSDKAIVTSLEIPGDSPFILGMGKQATELGIQGRLTAVSGIVNMKNMVFRIVNVAPNNNIYSGVFICVEFTVGEEQGMVDVYSYNMKFIKGSEMITME